MLAITRRELSALFHAPLAWVIAAVLQVFFAWFFLSTLEDYLALQDQLLLQDHAPGITSFLTFRYLAPCAGLLLILCPLIGMRSYADDYRQGTFILLQAAPISATRIVIGKFLAGFLFIAFIITLAILMPLSLFSLTRVDFNTLGLALIGLLAVAAFCMATAQLFSSLTRHALVAAIASATVLLLFWSIGKATLSGDQTQVIAQSLATSSHLGSFFQGLLNTADVIYFATLTALALALTVIRINGLGWSGSPGR